MDINRNIAASLNNYIIELDSIELSLEGENRSKTIEVSKTRLNALSNDINEIINNDTVNLSDKSLDQSYSNFKKLAKEVASAHAAMEAVKYLGRPEGDLLAKIVEGVTKGLARVIMEIVSVCLPDYNTAELLAKNNGKKENKLKQVELKEKITKLTETLSELLFKPPSKAGLFFAHKILRKRVKKNKQNKEHLYE